MKRRLSHSTLLRHNSAKNINIPNHSSYNTNKSPPSNHNSNHYNYQNNKYHNHNYHRSHNQFQNKIINQNKEDSNKQDPISQPPLIHNKKCEKIVVLESEILLTTTTYQQYTN